MYSRVWVAYSRVRPTRV